MRSDPGIFNFVKWLRVGEEACPTLEQAKARLRELFPSKPGWPDTTLVISHSKRMAVNAAANRPPWRRRQLQALARVVETHVIHMAAAGRAGLGISAPLCVAGGQTSSPMGVRAPRWSRPRRG